MSLSCCPDSDYTTPMFPYFRVVSVGVPVIQIRVNEMDLIWIVPSPCHLSVGELLEKGGKGN